MYKSISQVLGAFTEAGSYIMSLLPSIRTPPVVYLPPAADQSVTGVASAPAMVASTPMTRNPLSQPGPANGAVVRVVVKKGRLFHLIYVDVTDRSPTQAIVQELRLTAERSVHRTYVLRVLCNAFYDQHISIATAPAVPNVDSLVAIDVNTPRRPVEHTRRSDGVEWDMIPFIERYPMVVQRHPMVVQANGDGDSDGTTRYLLVEAKLKMHVVLMCSSAAVVASIVVGVLVGLLSRNAAYGIAATAGIIGILAFLVQLLAWAVAF
ncbi:hypothetical protein GGR53DRAFT_268820 [Hypoxylon sp. FL1150]|nr:hypothetical protein GGR53DRAFT_268820 [Hypoxylon sp. FL1150]